MCRRSLFALQNRLCGPPWCSPNSSQQYYFGNIAPKTALLCGHTALRAISLPLQCQNYGIIGFPAAKLTIPGGHDHTLAPIFRVCVTQNCNLDGRRCYLFASAANGAPPRCFVLYTFSKGAGILPIRTDNICPNRSY